MFILRCVYFTFYSLLLFALRFTMFLVEPDCGYNEEYVSCKTVCPPQSCNITYTEYTCGPQTCEPGCDCIKDHLRNKSNICILNDDCPAPVSCSIPSECRLTCSNRSPQNCAYEEPPDSNVDGCQCQKGYVLSEPEGICIRSEDCPLPECGYNETPVQCRSICPPQQCGVNPAVIRCKKPDCEPGCDCIEDHLRNASGLCIPSNECPKKCSIPDECKPTCALRNPPNCSKTEPPAANEDGCQCQKGYILSESNGKCIKVEECPLPKCNLFEVPVPCKTICPPQSCLRLVALFRCMEEIPCEPGCDCQSGYLRSSSGVCIPSDQCFKSNCSIPPEWRATCAVPNPKNCLYTELPTSNIDGCQCQKGYILSETDGKCIKVDDCPQDLGCNGDPHAVIKECPWPCPSTCNAPNTIQCKKACSPIGCQCQPGYLLSSIDGKCILPDKCKNGNPCGVNGTFSDCGFRCPNQYCPEDDDLTVIACKPGRPCPPGCLCKDNYKRKNYQENICVLTSDCPPVNCTRPNEVWNSCPRCLAERCEDRNLSIACDDPPGTDCQPRCVCATGFYRDNNDVCVCENECCN